MCRFLGAWFATSHTPSPRRILTAGSLSGRRLGFPTQSHLLNFVNLKLGPKSEPPQIMGVGQTLIRSTAQDLLDRGFFFSAAGFPPIATSLGRSRRGKKSGMQFDLVAECWNTVPVAGLAWDSQVSVGFVRGGFQRCRTWFGAPGKQNTKST